MNVALSIKKPQIDIVSFYMENADPGILHAQKEVFSELNIPLKQIRDTCSHGEFLTNYLRASEDQELVVFFDIDCIPLSTKRFWELANRAVSEQVLIGCAQQANHIDESNYWKWNREQHPLVRFEERLRRYWRQLLGLPNPPYINPFVYAGPCFLMIPIQGYQKIGMPSLAVDADFDAGGRLTHEWVESSQELQLLWPTSCQVPKYRYGDKFGFGLGTIFEDCVYHAFESTYKKGSIAPKMFIDKCHEVLLEHRSHAVGQSLLRK